MSADAAAHAITITRRLEFCAGHRVYLHESKCRNLHGHNYVLELTLRATAGLDPLGRVVDFSVVKQVVGGWIDSCWDHGFILYDKDAEALVALDAMGRGQKLYLMTTNPTAENMAAHLCHEVVPELLKSTGLRVVRVVLHETPNCRATVGEGA